MSLDVAGVRLNMPFPQAEIALSGTYKCDDYGKEVTFEEDLADELKRRRGQAAVRWAGSGPASLNCRGPNGENLRVEFAQDMSGPVVEEIVLQVPARAVAVDGVLRQLEAKYGKPDIGSLRSGRWCDARYRCDPYAIVPEGPEFVVRVLSDGVTITARRGIDAAKARQAALEAEADRLAPKKSRAAI